MNYAIDRVVLDLSSYLVSYRSSFQDIALSSSHSQQGLVSIAFEGPESTLVSRVTLLVVASTVTSSTLVAAITSSALVAELLRTLVLVGIVLLVVSIVLVVQLTRSLFGLVVGT